MFGKYPVEGRVAPETVEARNQRRLWAAIDRAIGEWLVDDRVETHAQFEAMRELTEVRDELKPKWINPDG